jgi:hypothetical protein
MSSISSTQQGFWLQGHYVEQNPPTCDVTGNGLRNIISTGYLPAAGCYPKFINSDTYSYSTCNDTGAYLWICSDNQCTQDCVLSSTETRTCWYSPFFTASRTLTLISRKCMQLLLALPPTKLKSSTNFATLSLLPLWLLLRPHPCKPPLPLLQAVPVLPLAHPYRLDRPQLRPMPLLLPRNNLPQLLRRPPLRPPNRLSRTFRSCPSF